MIRPILILVILFFGPRASVFPQTLSGHVYVLTESFSQDGCKPMIECDCCSSDIVFMTDKEFVMIDRCLHNDSFYKGKFEVNKENLTLKFNQLVVKEIYNENTQETKTEKKNLKIEPVKFYITSCGTDKLVLQRLGIKVLTKAFNVTLDSEEKIKKEIKESKAWKILE